MQKKWIIWVFVFTFIGSKSEAQIDYLDSLKQAFQIAQTDSVRFVISQGIEFYYREVNRDSALHYVDISIMLAEKNNRNLDLALVLDEKGYILMHSGKLAESLQYTQRAIDLLETLEGDQKYWYHFPTLSNHTSRIVKVISLATCHHHLGHLMGRASNYDQQIFHYKKTRSLITELGEALVLAGFANMNLGAVYLELNQLDSALVLEKAAEQIFLEEGQARYLSNVYRNMGIIYKQKDDYTLAEEYFQRAMQSSLRSDNLTTLSDTYSELSRMYLQEKKQDSSLNYAIKDLKLLQSMESKHLKDAYTNLYRSYQLADKEDSTYKYQGLALQAYIKEYEDQIESISELQNLTFSEAQRLQVLEKEKIDLRNKIRTYGLLAALVFLLIIGIILIKNNRRKQKSNKQLTDTLKNLKATQSQLIHSEKMASLGELTAGIAHEIQNPLNFINNFSEVSTEITTELKDEVKKGDMEEVIALSNDLLGNLQKITHHGKRADSIVKGMLMHSRNSGGEKVPTDLNAICDEYLRLSYHGMRAKNRDFNVEFHTDFDPNLPKVSVVPQDIGRVLLNIINNAFQAVADHGPRTTDNSNVTVASKFLKDKVQLIISDNGPGIPDEIKDKIFQPFFTTKPTGQGTGLGLSLSYDIVKAHGGELRVTTEQGKGSKFTIILPIEKQ